MSVSILPRGRTKLDLFWDYLRTGQVLRVGVALDLMTSTIPGSTTVYTCPSGKRAFVITLVLSAGGRAGYSASAEVRLVRADGTVLPLARMEKEFYSSGAGYNTTSVIYDIIVLEAGDSISIYGGTYSYTVVFAEIVEVST